MTILIAFLVNTLGGGLSGLLAGAAGATFMRRTGDTGKGAVLSFASGFILAGAFLELLANATRSNEETDWRLVLPLGGLVLGALLHFAIANIAGVHRLVERAGAERNERGNIAIRIAISMALVNVAEGISSGAGFSVSLRLGIILSGIMILENFMEGITISTQLTRASVRTSRVLLITSLPLSMLGIGAALGVFLGELSETIRPAILGLGAGIMINVAIDDVILEVHRIRHGIRTTLPLVCGILTEILLSTIETF